MTYGDLLGQVTQCASLFRPLGIGKTDVVALIMPNCNETVVAMLAALCTGIVNPINPRLETEQISRIIRGTQAKVAVTLRNIPKTDIAQKAANAVGFAPTVQTDLEAILAHRDVALAAAIGRPDQHSGELRCIYVQLNEGANTRESELMDFARKRVWEKAAVPKYIEIVDEMPLTMIGKVFKSQRRKMAIKRIYS